MLQGVEKKAVPSGRVRGMGGDKYGYHSIWDLPCHGHLLQVTWNNSLGVRQRLDRSGPLTLTGMTEVGAAVQGVDYVGYGCCGEFMWSWFRRF